MKRFIVASCLSFVLAYGYMASANAEGLRVGARAGGAMNFFSVPDSPSEYDAGFGFGGGAALKYPITEQLSVNPELGFYYRSLGGYSMGSEKITMPEMAISIPVLAQYAPIADVPFYAAAGVQLDIPFGSKYKHTYAGKSSSDDNKNRSSVDFALALGVGYMILPDLGADFRFAANLTQPFDENKAGYETSLMSIGLGVTYYFL
ncbi:MAG: PorT family protein [Chitinispirillales bacterium]|jgi:hypothetical protein|nr:PorT family protein [Chitinispirillales bacterium]